MLIHATMSTMLPATNMERAEKFYGETLGLKQVAKNPGGTTFETSNGDQIFVFGRGATLADHTVMAFHVEDFEAVFNGLKAKGITFEEYDQPGLKTDQGVVTMGHVKLAWFKDTEGNILGLFSKQSGNDDE